MHSTGEMNVWMSHSFYAYINHSHVNGRYKKNPQKKTKLGCSYICDNLHPCTNKNSYDFHYTL